MKEALYEHIEVTLNNPNDRRNLLLLKYIRPRSRKEETRYRKLCSIYPDNGYFEYDLVCELLELGLMRKEMTKDRIQAGSGQVLPGEFNPVTTSEGKQALSGLFPSEIEERNRVLHLYKVNKAAFWVSVIGGISGIITTVLTYLIN